MPNANFIRLKKSGPDKGLISFNRLVCSGLLDMKMSWKKCFHDCVYPLG